VKADATELPRFPAPASAIVCCRASMTTIFLLDGVPCAAQAMSCLARGRSSPLVRHLLRSGPWMPQDQRLSVLLQRARRRYSGRRSLAAAAADAMVEGLERKGGDGSRSPRARGSASNTLLSPLPSLRLSDDDIPAGNSHTLPMAPSASTSAAKTQILQHAGTGPTARTPTKITDPATHSSRQFRPRAAKSPRTSP
jgi:hypothetical protein